VEEDSVPTASGLCHDEIRVRWEVMKPTSAAKPPRRVEPRHESPKGNSENRWGNKVSRVSIACLNWSQ